LLSAMSINGYALVSNLPENEEVLKGTCSTFNVGESKDFIYSLKRLMSDNIIDRYKTFDVVDKYYNWDRITQQYCTLMGK